MTASELHAWHGLGLTDIIIVGGILSWLVYSFVDARGLSRSSKTLRRENEDLVRRNQELETTTARHEATIEQQGRQISQLEIEVAELKRTDQGAVLAALREHEANAALARRMNAELLTSIRDILQKGATP